MKSPAIRAFFIHVSAAGIIYILHDIMLPLLQDSGILILWHSDCPYGWLYFFLCCRLRIRFINCR